MENASNKKMNDDDWMSDDNLESKIDKLKLDLQKEEAVMKDSDEEIVAEKEPVKVQTTAQKEKVSSEKKDVKDAEMNGQKKDEIDDILSQLLAVQNKPVGTLVDLRLKSIQNLIQRALIIIKSQPMLLRIEAPITVGTDIHGQYYDLLRFMNIAGTPPEKSFLFLGDYVDRGK